MGPAWTDALRFAPGTNLRFVPALPPALRAALVQASPAAQAWLECLDAPVLTVLSVERDRCALGASTGVDSAHLGGVTATPGPDGAYSVRVQWTVAGGPGTRDFDGIALMLGGDHDVYLAQRTEAETRPLSRCHYTPDGNVSVSIYPAA